MTVARLTSGLVFNFGGGAPEVPVAAACSVQPTEVMVGEPVHATVVASNFNPKHTLTYAWASNGRARSRARIRAPPSTPTASAGGSYTATATVTDPKATKNNVGQLYRELHSEGTAQEPAADFLLGEPVDGPGRNSGHHHLQLHQSG